MLNSSASIHQELQDRIDELQAELREFHSLGRVPQPCHKPLSEELESKSPGMESDPGGTHSPYTVPGELITELHTSLAMTTEQYIETRRHTSMFFFFPPRYRFRGRAAVQHEPRGRDDARAAEGAAPSGSRGAAKPTGEQGGSAEAFSYITVRFTCLEQK